MQFVGNCLKRAGVAEAEEGHESAEGARGFSVRPREDRLILFRRRPFEGRVPGQGRFGGRVLRLPFSVVAIVAAWNWHVWDAVAENRLLFSVVIVRKMYRSHGIQVADFVIASNGQKCILYCMIQHRRNGMLENWKSGSCEMLEP